ncbi:peptidylprolyl isomerase [Porphyromonas circumdentaria]|uniref:peptidylprolyl isomerase n=1 Tax=Porphyromonas circumdentaria TaxID=29524 RepID=UPI0026DC78C6|nr:peptidylprolyl isomerase [Porphyromonas circumdentaria]MDO4722610.1 peptidylprolyl isomerase [Porphyromonas circumdentaria]
MKKVILLSLSLLLMASAAWAQLKAPCTEEAKTFVKVETNKGDFVVALYEGTPQHRDNFVRWVQEKAYERTIFHRVIHRFMIQGGNLMTRDATPQMDVSIDTISRMLPAEIDVARFFHKRGALCAAREGDDVNPEKASSSTQFYIVTGTYFTDIDLDEMERNKGLKYTPEQREAYKMYGGTPHLDQDYTVFGEVVQGMEVVEKIQSVKTDPVNRPTKDVIIRRITLVECPNSKKK